LRVGRAIGKSEEEIAPELMRQVKRYAPDEGPPALATDGKGAYREAMVETWGKIPVYGGRGAPPKLPKPEKDWQYLQVIKKRKGGKLESVRIKVIYGNEEKVKAKLGCHTAYVERTHLTSRQMNGRLVRKTLSFSKELPLLEAASALEDALYNFTRPVKTLRVELANPTRQARWQQRTPAMAAGLTDHVWTTRELLTTILVPQPMNT
jgi:putative lipoic acid-binding regulatory protein